MPNALILGASRGLGLGLARELSGRGWTVTGTVRKDADRAGLEATGARSAMADITDPATLEALGASDLDLLFVNAGISEPDDLASIDLDGIGHLFMTNAVAPVRAALALLGAVKPAGMVAFMSSRMGSVALTTQDNKAMYRASKAALNSLTRAKIDSFGGPPGAVLPPRLGRDRHGRQGRRPRCGDQREGHRRRPRGTSRRAWLRLRRLQRQDAGLVASRDVPIRRPLRG